MAKRLSEAKANEVFNMIVGKRFQNEEAIEKWIREFTKCELEGLIVGELQHPENEDDEDDDDLMTDDFMDCCFGEDECGMDYADFILYAIRTNENKLYITEAGWMY